MYGPGSPRRRHTAQSSEPEGAGQALMNRTLKGATVKRYHYESHDQLGRHLADFVIAYDFTRRLQTLKSLMNPTHRSPS